MDIDQLNIETAIFLRRLRMFSECTTIQINEKTAELFMDIVQCVDKLTKTSEMIPIKNKNCTDFLVNLNENHFDLRQHIMCRLCIEQIGVSKDDLEMHLQKNSHMDKAQKIMENAVVRHTIEKTANGLNRPGDDNPIACAVKHSIDAQPVSQPSKCDSLHIIRLKNIAWTATKRNIVDFFQDMRIVCQNVHFIIADELNYNDAFIQLASSKDYQLALKCKEVRMGYTTAKAIPADIDMFIDLVDQPTYPLNQRVLRLKKLPMNCTTPDIRRFFNGQLISEVHLIHNYDTHNEKYEFIGEAFVIFESVNDIELALDSVMKDNKKIENKFIKVFRSSLDQYQAYCEKHEMKNLSTCPKDEQASSLEDSASSNQNAAVPSAVKDVNETGIIMARGFPWKVTQEDVATFFANVNIIGGFQGIQIKRNGRMEAVFMAKTKEDIRKALALDKQTVDSRTIHVTQIKS